MMLLQLPQLERLRTCPSSTAGADDAEEKILSADLTLLLAAPSALACGQAEPAGPAWEWGSGLCSCETCVSPPLAISFPKF